MDSKDDVEVPVASEIERFLEFCRRGNTESVQDLLKSNTQLVKQAGNLGYTGLHWASLCGHADIVQLLIDHKADINALTTQHETPLHLASWKDHEDCVKALLAAHADRNVKNKDGKSALELAHSESMRATLTKLDQSEMKSMIHVVEDQDDDDDW